MKKKAFGLPMAIFIMVLMATLGIYSFYITTQTVETVTDSDIANQLELYADSVAEINLLWLSADHERVKDTSTFEITFDDFYFFTVQNTPILETFKDINSTQVVERNSSVIMDIVGTTKQEITGVPQRRITKRLVGKP